MAGTTTTGDPRLPVAAAARAIGVPERSLFRAVKKKVVASTRREGVTVVDPADVTAWRDRRAAGRKLRDGAAETAAGVSTISRPGAALAAGAAEMPGSLPAGPGIAADGSGSGSPATALDGDPATTTQFPAIEAGATPIDDSRRLCGPPQIVPVAHATHGQLGSAIAPSPVPTQIDQLRMAVEVLTAEVSRTVERVDRVAADLAALAKGAGEVAALSRERFTCDCGESGWVAAHVRCTACGKDTVWGFFPGR